MIRHSLVYMVKLFKPGKKVRYAATFTNPQYRTIKLNTSVKNSSTLLLYFRTSRKLVNKLNKNLVSRVACACTTSTRLARVVGGWRWPVGVGVHSHKLTQVEKFVPALLSRVFQTRVGL